MTWSQMRQDASADSTIACAHPMPAVQVRPKTVIVCTDRAVLYIHMRICHSTTALTEEVATGCRHTLRPRLLCIPAGVAAHSQPAWVIISRPARRHPRQTVISLQAMSSTGQRGHAAQVRTGQTCSRACTSFADVAIHSMQVASVELADASCQQCPSKQCACARHLHIVTPAALVPSNRRVTRLHANEGSAGIDCALVLMRQRLQGQFCVVSEIVPDCQIRLRAIRTRFVHAACLLAAS